VLREKRGGVAAVALMIIQLLFLPFWPGSSGYAVVFTGTVLGLIRVYSAGLVTRRISASVIMFSAS
jgi:hypothetical protein